MRLTVTHGHVHGEPVGTWTHSVDEDTLLEHGFEACDEITKAVLEHARTKLMHPEVATWVTIEWTWKPL